MTLDPTIVAATEAEPEMRDFLRGLVLLLRPQLVVETGSYLGSTTRELGKACLWNRMGRVVSCDVDPHYVRVARARCHGLPVEVRLGPSAALPELEQADLLFIDSDYAGREAEIRRAKPGAILVVHDTAISYDSTVPPLEGLVRALGGVAFPTARGFGILLKP